MRRVGIRRWEAWGKLVGIGLVSLGLMGFGNGVAGKNRKGNELFAQGKYEEALELYRDAQVERPDLPALHLNVGNALYKQDGLDQALSEYQRALEGDGSSMKAKVYYNMGNAFFTQGKLEEAIEAYKKSLSLDPGDLEAKFNLEFAQLRVQEQQQENQQQQQEQEEGEQNEEQESQEGDQQNNRNEQNEQKNEEQGEQGEDAPTEPQERPDGQMSEEEAERILNALNDKEKEVQERRRVKATRRRIRELDW